MQIRPLLLLGFCHVGPFLFSVTPVFAVSVGLTDVESTHHLHDDTAQADVPLSLPSQLSSILLPSHASIKKHEPLINHDVVTKWSKDGIFLESNEDHIAIMTHAPSHAASDVTTYNRLLESRVVKVNNVLDTQSKHYRHSSPHHSSLPSAAIFDHLTEGDLGKSEQANDDNNFVNDFGESICGINTSSRNLNRFHTSDSSDVHNIVGGIEAKIGRYPYVVGLASSYNFREFYCVGSLIAPDTVLTAAHCIDPLSNDFVAINGHDTSDWEGEVIPMTKAVIHPNYNDNTIANNFAVVILEAATSQDVKFIKLNPDESYPSENSISRVMGWGDTTEGGYQSELLLEVDLTVISNENCDQCHQLDIGPSMICTFDPGHDSCGGDGGKLL
ncbi:hypothetical protein ACHAWX_001829 [Stephanocyclus meneghinianus]